MCVRGTNLRGAGLDLCPPGAATAVGVTHQYKKLEMLEVLGEKIAPPPGLKLGWTNRPAPPQPSPGGRWLLLVPAVPSNPPLLLHAAGDTLTVGDGVLA